MFAAAVERWRDAAQAAAVRHGLPANTLLALIARESSGNPKAISSSGAVGLVQVKPIVVTEYNRVHGSAWNAAHVLDQPALGLEIGAWLFSKHYARLPGVASPWDRFALADLAYAQGWKAFTDLIKSLGFELSGLSWSALRDKAPSWGAPEHPFNHSRYVADHSLGGTPGPEPLAGLSVAALAGVLVVLAVIVAALVLS